MANACGHLANTFAYHKIGFLLFYIKRKVAQEIKLQDTKSFTAKYVQFGTLVLQPLCLIFYNNT
jgi:hypothetical protein